MSTSHALCGARIFDGETWYEDKCLLIRDGKVAGLAEAGQIEDAARIELDGGILAPGFVDLQVNGGGGVLLNEVPSLEGIRTICETFAQFGTTALLPTLITDTPAVTASAIAAGTEAARQQVPGFLGLHLEGPHLSLARKGAHDPALIRPMNETDIEGLIAARNALPALLSTVAAETVTPTQIERLVRAGIIVSLGHSDAPIALARAAADAGASMVTHLFNAMSALGHREPGMVGLALDNGALYAGLIADGLHVDPVAVGIAMRAKIGPGRIFLVTDAMSMTGTELTSFTLNGRLIRRAEGALRLENGTLAGADLTMIRAVKFMHETIGLPLGEALRMASLYPAEAMGLTGEHGALVTGARADIVHLSDQLAVRQTWIGGKEVFRA